MKFNADSFLQRCNRPPSHKGYVQTSTGTLFDVLDPQPSQVNIIDIAQGLAYKYRYTGQLGPVTVAEHCVMASRIVECLGGDATMQMRALLHDACEAYTHDLIMPIRTSTSVQLRDGTTIPWDSLDDRVSLAVSAKLLDGVLFTEFPIVQAADVIAFLIEKRQIPVMRDADLGLPEIPDEAVHFQIAFLNPDDAHFAFMCQYEKLQAKLNAGN